MPMKSYLMENLQCSQCQGDYGFDDTSLHLICKQCNHQVQLQDGIPIFTPPPQGIVPSEKVARGPHLGTPWRQANWRFLEEQVASLRSDALILDVGAGRGDFASLFDGHQSLAIDVYPYPEVDLVCDLSQNQPLRREKFDLITLMNVLEHVFETKDLITTLSKLLKPGGALIVAIPFMVKMHQVPIDFVRYTHFYLEKLGIEHQLIVENIEGFYDPVFFLNEGIGNIKWSILPGIRGLRHYSGRILLWFLQLLASGLRVLVGPGKLLHPSQTRSLAPTGYHVIYRKPIQ